MDHPYRQGPPPAAEPPAALEPRYRLPSLGAVSWWYRLELLPLLLGCSYFALSVAWSWAGIFLRPTRVRLEALFGWETPRPLIAGLVLYGTALLLWRRRRNEGADEVRARNEAAVALLLGGEVTRANAELDALLASGRATPFHRAVLVMNRGLGYLRAGDLGRGRALLEHVLRSRLLEAAADFVPHRAVAHRHLATCCALGGDLRAAEEHLAAAQGLTPEHKRDETLLAEVIVALAADRAGAAVQLTDARWRGAETHLRPFQLKTLRLLRLLALARLGSVSDDEIARTKAAVEPVAAQGLEPYLTHLPGFAGLVRGRLGLS